LYAGLGMKSSQDLYYVDTPIWLALLKNEQRPPGEMEGVRDLAKKIQNNEIRIVISVATKAEVLKSTLDDKAKKMWEALLKRKNILVADTDNRIWQIAYEIRDYYQVQKKIDKLTTVSLPDSIHLATAIHFSANAFYTFDGKNKSNSRGLIPLSGSVAGKYPLVIKKPQTQQTSFLGQIT